MDERTRLSLTKRTFDGKSALAPVSAFRWLEALVAYGLKPREVPGDSWEAGDDVALVNCACGQPVTVRTAVFAEHCVCGRRFIYDGTAVWSLLPPGALRLERVA